MTGGDSYYSLRSLSLNYADAGDASFAAATADNLVVLNRAIRPDVLIFFLSLSLLPPLLKTKT